MTEIESNPHTVIFFTLFLFFYFVFLFFRLKKNSLDLYDSFFALSVVGAPAFFIYFPKYAKLLSTVFGVTFPFVLLFSALIFLNFLKTFQLSQELHALKHSLKIVIQKNALLENRLNQDKQP